MAAIWQDTGSKHWSSFNGGEIQEMQWKMCAASNMNHRALTHKRGSRRQARARIWVHPASQTAVPPLHPTLGTSSCLDFGHTQHFANTLVLFLCNAFSALPEPVIQCQQLCGTGDKLLHRKVAHPFLGTSWHCL